MQTSEYRIFHETRENYLAPRIVPVNTQSDPLKTLKVLVEGLAGDQQTGVWLTPLKALPAVPRLSPYDLAYLDGEGRIVSTLELAPSDPFPRHLNEAASALILPWRTLSTSQIQPGDRVVLRLAEKTLPLTERPAGRGPAPLVSPSVVQNSRSGVSQLRPSVDPLSPEVDSAPAAGHSSRFASLRTSTTPPTGDPTPATASLSSTIGVDASAGVSPHPQPAPLTPARSAARTPGVSHWRFMRKSIAGWNRIWRGFRSRHLRSGSALRRSPHIVEEC